MAAMIHLPASLYLYFIGLSVLAGLLTYKYNRSVPLKLLFFFLVYTLLNELVAFNMMSRHTSNRWLYNVYNYIRFPYLAIIYYYCLDDRRLRNVILLFIMSVPVALLINFFIYQTFYILHTLFYLYGAVFIIFLSLSYLRKQLFYPLQESIFHNPFFWISSGILFYFLANGPFIGAANFLSQRYRELGIQLYLIVYIMNLIMYSLISVGFFMSWKHRKSAI